MTTIKKYNEFRRAGYSAIESLRNAKIVVAFNAVDDDLARIVAEHECEAYDIGDCGNAYVNAHGRRVSAEEATKEIEHLIETYGNYCVMAQVRDDDESEWETVDSIGQCGGYKNPCDPVENNYVVDLMSAALDAIEARAWNTQTAN